MAFSQSQPSSFRSQPKTARAKREGYKKMKKKFIRTLQKGKLDKHRQARTKGSVLKMGGVRKENERA